MTKNKKLDRNEVSEILKILNKLTKVDWEYDKEKVLFKWIFHSICVWIKPDYNTKSWACWTTANEDCRIWQLQPIAKRNISMDIGLLKEAGLMIVVKYYKSLEIKFRKIK